MKKQDKNWNNWLLILAVTTLTIIPLVVIRDSNFAGADGKAKEFITTIKPEYKPWFQPVIQLPGGEVESLLFALQAGIGAGVVGYVIGLYQGRSQGNSSSKNED